MAKPIAPKDQIAFAFPDICNTPTPGGSPVPIPYPNIAQLSDATGVSDEGGKELLVGGKHVLLKNSLVSTSTGDEAGSASPTKGTCKMVQASTTVKYGSSGLGLVRFMDQTEQNGGNAIGAVISANPTVLVGD